MRVVAFLLCRLSVSSGRNVPIAPGGYHTCALKQSDQTAICWGMDNYGQVNNTPTNTPFVSIAAGFSHNCALKQSDQTAICWGYDEYGQVSNTPTNTPFVSIAAGDSYNCALKQSDQTAICWGSDEYGQVVLAVKGALERLSDTHHRSR